MLERELKLKAQRSIRTIYSSSRNVCRVQSLEKEITELKEKIAIKTASRQSVHKRVPSTSVGFGASVNQTRMTPEVIAASKRFNGDSTFVPRVCCSLASPTPAAVANSSTAHSLCQVVGLGDQKLFKSSSESDVPHERRSQYNAGGTKLTVSLPAQFVGVTQKNVEPSETLQVRRIIICLFVCLII